MEIGIQTGGIVDEYGIKEGYEMIARAGFTALDWNLNQAWKRKEILQRKLGYCVFEDSMEEVRAYFEEELQEIRRLGLHPNQAHSPFPAYVQDFPGFNEYAIRVYHQCIRYCQEAGVKYLVIHGISLEIDDKSQNRESIRKMNEHMYESLIPTLVDTDVTVCMENLFTHYKSQNIEGVCSVPEEAIRLIDSMNEKAGKECFGLCLDTGHLNLLGKNPKDYIHQLGNRIKALHVHDNHGEREDEHMAPFTGTIRWMDVLESLADVGYCGDISFETFRQVEPKRLEKRYVPIWLRTIYEIGDQFRKDIEERKSQVREEI